MNKLGIDTEKETSWLEWLEITATLTGLIGIVVLIALMTQSVWAQPPAARDGFKPGPRTFTNPFADSDSGAGANEDDFFDEDEEEEFEYPDAAAPRSAPVQRGSNTSPRPGGNTGNAPEPQRTNKGISMGGGTPGNVISGNESPSIDINTETGSGSKEVVTDFNFPDADIMDIAKTLGKLTGKNFILDKDVKGRITIISNSAITVGDAWRAFLTALDINGFALIPSGKYIRIARQRDARDKQLKTFTGDSAPDTDTLITRVFQLKYIDSQEVARTFRSFMPANSRIIPYEQTNTVIVTDTGSNINKLQRMLDILDVEGFEAGIEVIPVKFASAAELSKLIDTLIPGTGAKGPTAGGVPRFGAASRFSARRTKEGGIINTIIADDRTNTLIVHANTRGADQVRELVAKLDQKVPAVQGGGKVHVIYLQFADSEQIATTLNNLSQQTSGGFRPLTPAGTGGTGVNPVSASLFEGSIKISADKATNSLVVTASPADFVTVQRVVNRLDIPRDEVYVEVVIMEVSLGRTFQFSTNVVNPKNGIAFSPNTDLLDFIQSPLSQKGAILGFGTKATTEVLIGTTKFNVPNVQSLIKTLQTNTNANVIATPQIIALDNTEATFESSEKIPVPKVTAVQGAGIATGIDRESVSLSIKIKPQINKISNFVKLDVQAKLADFSNRELPAQVAGLALATIERSAQTTVVVGDSDTVVIGGLIRDKQSDTVSKIPILGDIPLLGWLFRAKNQSTEKTNLLIFLTPHIVRQYEKVRAILDKKLQERDDFLEQNAGGRDPQRKQRDEIIRALPDVTQFKAWKTERSVTLNEDEPAAVSVGSGPSESEDTKPPASQPGEPVPASPEDSAPPPIMEDVPPPPIPDFEAGGGPVNE
ncbi:MAG: type II secretion system protein GspD [Bdellovibrionales bacterium GWB1_55_8]|nr:MAG: type II secretion system protein GspD [Bdellovibrionales bacterium GWB1_55_8]